MAERRMFAKTIIDSDAFLDMPLSAQSLYFHLAMRADDDGFVNNPKKVQRMIGASDDDCKLLIMKRFILAFESGVIVIKHWRIHNYIQKDRYKATAYEDEKAQLIVKDNNAYTLVGNDEIPLIDDSSKTLRQKAYAESELPYSFDYKIRAAFVGKHCPICNCKMGYDNNLIKPTIQHNIPISKGGKHELGNISVICQRCNTSIQDNETDKLNAEQVIDEWEKISCTRLVHGMDTQDRLDKKSKELSNNISSEKPKEKTSEYVKSVIDYLNKKANKNYRASTESTARHIRARLNEGFSLDDFYAVIDKKCAEWLGTEWEKYLRPETLFGSKFESYLNTNVVKQRGANGVLLDARNNDELDGIL